MEPECVVCLQVYDEGEHTPRVLSCGHSVCQNCVLDLRSHWGGNSGSERGGHVGGGLVRCPECKQHTKVPLGGLLELPKNIELMRLIQGHVPKPQAMDPTKPWPLFKWVYGEPPVWILPQAGVKKKGMVYGFCIGEMFGEKKLEVSLHHLSKVDPYDRIKSLNYEELVRLAWSKLHPEAQTKLLHLLALGSHCNYFAEVAGLWMSEEGVLFLVSKVYVEGIKQAKTLLFPKPDNTSLGKENDVCGGSLRTLIRLGVELCEMLLEVHAAGVILGILGPDSLALDAYGHFRLYVGNCILWRRCTGDSFASSKLKPCISSLGVGTLTIEEIDEANDRCGETLGSCLSPEVLELFKRSVNTDKPAGVVLAVSSSEIVTQKADVWSLGCVLLQLLSGSSLLGGLMFSEVHTTQQEALEQNVHFKEQLLNCIARAPSSRPQVVNIWWELKELLDDQALGIPPSHFAELDSKQGKLELEMPESESTVGNALADDCRVDLGTAAEARADSLQDPETSTIQATADAPSLPRALIDVEQCNAEVKTLHGHLDTVSCLCVCGSYLISASYDKTLRVWSLNDYKMVQVFEGHEQRITALAVYEASQLCVSGDYGGHIYAWNVASRAPVATWLEHQDWRYSGVSSLAISSDELLYSGSGDRTIKAWSTLGFKHVATMEGHKGVVSVLMVEGQMLYSGSWDGTIRLWWRPDHSPLASFSGASGVPLGGIRALVKCPTNGLLFSGHDSGVIQIWNEEDCVGTLKAHKGVVSALALDQGWLYSSSWDGFVKAWPLEDVSSGGAIPVEKKCSNAAVTALCCCGQDKLFVGILQKIQVYRREVAI